MTAMRYGIQAITYSLDWPSSLLAAQTAERLGFDYLFGHDHLYSTGGNIFQPFFEGWTTITAWAALTSRIRLGVLVGANPFRNPGLVAKMAVTIDHISGGRLLLGLGAGNRELEVTAHGIDGGATVGQRLERLDEALTIVRGLLAGDEVTHHSEAYHFDQVRHAPVPLQAHVPIVVGASGEKKGLRIVARHADMWQTWLSIGQLDRFLHKNRILGEHCAVIGRDPASIERAIGGKLVIRRTADEAWRVFREQMEVHQWPESIIEEMAWVGSPEEVADAIHGFRSAGADGFIASLAAPLDLETMELFATQVRPMVEALDRS